MTADPAENTTTGTPTAEVSTAGATTAERVIGGSKTPDRPTDDAFGGGGAAAPAAPAQTLPAFVMVGGDAPVCTDGVCDV
ncbi:hypothetical protein [Cellulomonas sp. PhB143]|uniref:hypothetical protein n=1 Tax=Cellulomonas sp. PhB143 TaxID=2485186 RepID=UPI000F46B920|nr:hypothetical protein [Cellulomonas sp. PhB143]ROS79173.1 hypothetical protein EDF32_0055 [Cellulomonas sp. PhB143]